MSDIREFPIGETFNLLLGPLDTLLILNETARQLDMRERELRIQELQEHIAEIEASRHVE